MSELARQKQEILAVKNRLWGKPKSKNVVTIEKLKHEREELEARRRVEEIEAKKREAIMKEEERLRKTRVNGFVISEFAISKSADIQYRDDYSIALVSGVKYDIISQKIYEIVRVVLDGHPGITIDDIRSRDKHRHIMAARQEAVVAVKMKMPEVSSTEMGRWFDRHHSTILNALWKAGVPTSSFDSEEKQNPASM